MRSRNPRPEPGERILQQYKTLLKDSGLKETNDWGTENITTKVNMVDDPKDKEDADTPSQRRE